MWKIDDIEKLQNSLIDFTNNDDTHYGDLARDEQGVADVVQALFMRLEKLKRRYEAGGEPEDDDGNEIADKMQLLGMLAELGALKKALHPKNRDNFSKILGAIGAAGLDEAGLSEAGLRKKDAAAYLRHSADTDLHLSKQKEIDELADKKDK